MSVPFKCPYCNQETHVSDEYVGLSGPCFSCGKTVTIPDPGNPFSDAYKAPAVPTFDPPPPPSYNIEEDPAMRMLLPVGRSGWAIAAGYAGIFALFCHIPGPIAIILGWLAIRDIRRNPDRHGMGRAIFAIVTGIIGTLFLVMWVVIIVIDASRL